MKKLTWMLLLCCSRLAAQDLHFSQFYEQPLLRNPALAGVFDGNFRAKAVYRNQWQSVTVPYRTNGLSAEFKFPGNGNNWHALGAQVLHDVAGDSKFGRTMIVPGYSYHLELQPDNYLSMGVMAGPVTTSFDNTKLRWDDQFVNGQYSPSNPTSQVFLSAPRRTYLELAAGLLFTRPLGDMGNLYTGVSLFHANRPVVSLNRANNSRLDRKLGVNLGVTVPSGTYDWFTLYGDAFFQGRQQMYMLGALYDIGVSKDHPDEPNRTVLTLGSLYRWQDALVPVLKLQVSNVSVGLSYDVNISPLKTASQYRGGFELTLSYRNYAVGGDYNGMPCPRLGKGF